MSATPNTPVIALGPSPYQSIDTNSKNWNITTNTLGGSRGIDTGEPRLTGNIRHTSVGTTSLDIRVYAINDQSGVRELISEYSGIEYEPVSTRIDGYSSTHSGSTFGYHFILRGPHLSSSDPEYYRGVWLKDHDPRNPKPEFNPDWNLDNDQQNNTGSPYVPIKDGISPLLIIDPSEINETSSTINTVVFRRFMDRSNGDVSSGGYFNKLWQDAPIFEIPQERLLSLASLQHLYFHNERPYKVGNSWGANGKINTLEWFDRYYFSGLSRSDNTEEFNPNVGMPNPSLDIYIWDDPATEISKWQSAPTDDTIQSKELASKVLIQNRFNLNSTSIAAWKSVLGGLRLHEWDYIDYPEDDTSDLTNLSLKTDTQDVTFTRFSHSLSETYEAPETPAFAGAEPVAPSAYYRRGARRIRETEIESLATELVGRIKERGEPFYSMEDFLSPDDLEEESLLESAIRTVFAPDGRQEWDHEWEVEGNQDSASEAIYVDHFSPGFLTQADVMTALGPTIFPRSDTFKIRTRATVYSKFGSDSGTAALEATFQRIPTPVESTSSIGMSNSRKFALVSMQWLEESQL